MDALTWLPAAAAECHRLADAYAAAARLDRLARKHGDLIGDVAAYRKQDRAALRAETAATSACLKRFAESRGWRPGKQAVTVDALFSAGERRAVPAVPGNVIDHAVELKADRRVIAVLSHTYAPLSAIERFADAHGLRHEVLPASWYSPLTAAVVFTRREL